MPRRILIVGSSIPLIETAVDALQDKGYSFTQLDMVEHAAETLARRFFPLVVIDMPGIDVSLTAKRFREISPLSVIVTPAAQNAAPVLPAASTEQEAAAFIGRLEPFTMAGSLSLERLAALVEEGRRAKKRDSARSVLFVDDNSSLVQSYIPLLADEGYTVTGAKSGREAIDAMRSGYYGIVVMDYKLPDMSGMDAGRRLRQIDPDAPLIFMTAFADLDIVLEALKEQASDFLIKPIDPQKLFATLKKVSALMQNKSK